VQRFVKSILLNKYVDDKHDAKMVSNIVSQKVDLTASSK